LARQLRALLCLSGMTSKKQQQNEAESLFRVHCPLCAHGASSGHWYWLPSDHTWSRPEQAHRLPGAQLPRHETANDKAKRASPHCFQLNPRATMLSFSGVPPSECVQPFHSHWFQIRKRLKINLGTKGLNSCTMPYIFSWLPIKLEGIKRVQTHAVLLYLNPNLSTLKQTTSLLGYPKVILYTKSEHLGLCCRQTNKQTDKQIDGLKCSTHADSRHGQ